MVKNEPNVTRGNSVVLGKEFYTFDLTHYGKQGGAQRYEFWVHCIFLVLAPWLSVAILNGFIINNLLVRARSKLSMRYLVFVR